MHIRSINTNLPKTGELVPELTEAEPGKEISQRVIAHGFLSERELGASKQAHRHIWFSNRTEATRECIGEPGRH